MLPAPSFRLRVDAADGWQAEIRASRSRSFRARPRNLIEFTVHAATRPLSRTTHAPPAWLRSPSNGDYSSTERFHMANRRLAHGWTGRRWCSTGLAGGHVGVPSQWIASDQQGSPVDRGARASSLPPGLTGEVRVASTSSGMTGAHTPRTTGHGIGGAPRRRT